MAFTKTQTQLLACSLAMGSPRLWAVPEAEMRNTSLSGLDLLEGPPWFCDAAEGHVGVSGPDGARGQVDVGGLSYHLMLWMSGLCHGLGHVDFCGSVLFLGPCGCGWPVLPT